MTIFFLAKNLLEFNSANRARYLVGGSMDIQCANFFCQQHALAKFFPGENFHVYVKG